MPQKSRELSQFGSFLEVNNSNKNIGIATTATPYVGIGTADPTYKFHVVGDTNIDGSVYSSGYYLNGNPLIDATLETWSISGSDIYRLNGNVGIGTSVFPSKFSVLGNVTILGNTNTSGVVTASRFISTVSTGTAPFTVTSQTEVANLNASFLRGKTPPSGTIVGTTDEQTLTNKTLTSPTITSIVNSGTKTIPTGIGTFVITGASGIVTSGMIADLSIVNADVSSSAAIDYSKLNLTGSIANSDISAGAGISISKLSASTISGISLGSNLNNLTAGSYINYSSGSTYNGSSPITVSVAGTTANTANTLIARGSSGDFSAGDISCANLNATFTVTSNDINSTGNVLIGSATTTGTASQPLQVTGGAYISSSVGIGTTNPRQSLDIVGNINLDTTSEERRVIFSSGVTTSYFYGNTISGRYGLYDVTNNRNIFTYYSSSNEIGIDGAAKFSLVRHAFDITNGRLGVGLTSPTYGLHVYQNVADYAVNITNDGNNVNRQGILVSCGTTNASGTNTAIVFADGDGTAQGSITFSFGTVTYGAFTANHDAILPEEDNDDGYEYGTLVGFSSITYKTNSSGQPTQRGILYYSEKSTQKYQKNLLGAYSGKYDNQENLHQVAVLGDGHILCCGETGNISVGDGITSSSTEGLGMKMDKPGLVIGIAQENVSFAGTESKLVAVQYGLHHYIPDDWFTT